MNNSLWNNNWHSVASRFKKECEKFHHQFLFALTHPLKTQQHVLDDLMQISKNTLFGKVHQLDTIKNINMFKDIIPIRDYTLFETWINQEITATSNILTNSPIMRWLKTSGTTGTPKKIPYSLHWLSHYRVPAMKAMWAIYLSYCQNFYSNPYAILDTQSVRETATEHLNGIPYQSITNRNPMLHPLDWNPPWYHAPWYTPDVPNHYDMRMYYRLRYFLGKDLRVLTAVNPSTLMSFKQQLITHLPQLIDDIKHGNVLSIKCMQTNERLATKLSYLLNVNNFSFDEIWPNLSLITCWTSASAKLYLSTLKELFPTAAILPFMNCGTEGVVSIPIHHAAMPLAINQALFEFVPTSIDVMNKIKTGEKIDTLSFQEVEANQEYYLIMSQANGLYRLLTGDIYRINDFYHRVPCIEYIRRHGDFHSFTGEKLTESQITNAIHKIYEEHGISHGLYICNPIWDTPPYYTIYTEITYRNRLKINNSAFAKEVDDALQEINCEYNSKRTTNRIGSLRIIFINVGTINLYLDKIKKKNNAIQSKYRPIQLNDDVIEEILSLSNHLMVSP